MSISVREFKASDDIVALTELLHRAYAPLAERGLRFYATHQPPEVTAERIADGTCFVLEEDARLLGTITVYGAYPESEVPCYREPGTFHFGQFGVEPQCKGRGYGRMLHARIVEHARANGGKVMALDTAAPATELIAMYERWGYREIGRCKWGVTNYESVVMSRALERPN